MRFRRTIFDTILRPPYHAPAMTNPLFNPVSPKELAEVGQVIDIKENIENFERLVEFVEADLETDSAESRPRRWRAAPVDIRLEFAWSDSLQKIPVVRGQISASIVSVCQRCLEVFPLQINASLKWLLLEPGEEPGEMTDLASHEVWELEQEFVRLVDIVEESLLMAMPLAPKHESVDSCATPVKEFEVVGVETSRPFSDLKSQMEKSEK